MVRIQWHRLSDESTGDPADGSTDGTAVKLIEGHPTDYELTEGHPPNGEIAGGHPPPLMMSSHACVAGHVTGSNTSGASL